MRKEEVQRLIEDRLDKIGVPASVRAVREVPSSIECHVLAGAEQLRLAARSGITRAELDQQLARLEAWWTAHQSQRDLEEAIADTESAL